MSGVNMKILVVGSGTMGHGIAEVAAISGFDVKLVDISWEILNRAKEKMIDSLKKLYEKGTIKDPPESIMSKIEMSISYDVAKDIDIAIEAVPEIIDLKRKVFSELDKMAPPHAILATNTSSIPISDIAEITSRKENVIGMHFFNPPPIMKLVEIIPSKYTSSYTIDKIIELSKRMNKIPVRLKVEVPGFVSNRLYLRLLQEACREVEAGEAKIEDVDSAARYKLRLPMGIFELADYVGLDVSVDLWNVIVSRGTTDVKCSLFREKVKSKELGVKSGKGFYNYPGGKYVKPDIPKESNVNASRLISLAVNEAAWLIENKIVSAMEIDTVMKYGFNFPQGLLEIADNLGLDNILHELEDIHSNGYEAYAPNALLKNMVDNGYIGKKSGKGFYEYS